jgi:hypothetical protein
MSDVRGKSSSRSLRHPSPLTVPRAARVLRSARRRWLERRSHGRSPAG